MINSKPKNFYPGWKFNNSYIKLPKTLYSEIKPTPVKNPKLTIFNNDLSDTLNLNFEKISSDEKALIFSGNILPEGSNPIAQAYSGHQFGHFTMLGDGRATLLGEHKIGKTDKKVDIQLKGSGITPYSRNGDGRATLESMLREYLFSETMYGLNIPTTRSLAVVSTGEDVRREESYTGGILTRVASSHIRVGTFQYLSANNDTQALKELVNYSLKRHFSDFSIDVNPSITLLNCVMEKQINLINNWMRVGYIMGVANTDNVTISGESIDYGPCSFMNTYNLDSVYSSIDNSGRYSFGNQPLIGHWNISRFAETLIPLLDNDKKKSIRIGEDIINSYPDKFKNQWLAMMKNKLGFSGYNKNDDIFIKKILNWMSLNKIDYTNFFCYLMSQKIDNELNKNNNFKEIYKEWQDRISKNTVQKKITDKIMRFNNPLVVPRNYIVEEALKLTTKENNFDKFNELLNIIKQPYEKNKNTLRYQKPPSALHDHNYKTYCGT